jgi:hypothetical protein
MKNLLGTFLFASIIVMTIAAPKAQADEDPTMYILKGLASYEVVQHQLKIVSKKVQKTTGLSQKTIVHISGTISQVAQQKFSTKLLNISTNIKDVSIKPVFEYSFKTDEAVATVGINYSF